MASARGPAYLLTLGRWRRGLGLATQSRALAALVPGVSQVDNKSDFLGKRSHRRHPGILQLSRVRLPQVLVDAAQLLLLESSMPNMEKQVQALTNYLWSRHLPVEPEELQRRAVHLEKKFLENADSCQMEKLCGEVLHALRRTTYHWQELSYSEGLSLVYMAARLDGGFAAVSRAFHEIQARLPEFQPQTLMDFGSGTGSVTWAAHSTWGQSLREYMCVDSSAAMLELAEKLLKGGSGSGMPYVPGVFFRQFLPVSPKVQFDVVVSAFSLSELPSKANRTDVVQTLWRKTGHFLILVENGTKAGHSLLMDARDLVLNGKEKSPLDPRPGFVFAPCPHELPCPQLTASKPLACSFSQAYHPIPFSWNKKPKEEKFSMVILARGSPEEANRWPRITQPVLKRPRHVHCHLCCPDGHMQHAVITARRHGRDLYRCARVSSWGDRLPVITPSELPPSPAQDPPES
ncbi:ribosome assembly protein METTL17, mitochondrial [Globicephala melas]|uniref:ribosome assembly protein METTL17, mitochondrial n=1 Tax=Globicephala melas TaxID=9731 RepID=UPI00122EDEBD|nr:methyltransferase-like protein 17, mitochondrial [Globicephala melas]